MACTVALLLEAGFERLVESEGAPGITQSVFNLSALYQRLVAAPRDPVFPRYTAAVEINSETDAVAIDLNDICGQRKMLAQLLRGIAAASPSVIVVDKYFLPRDCGDSNRLLNEAVRDVSRDTPLVIGRRIADEVAGRPGKEGPYLMDSLAFRVQDALLREGVVNIDSDTRKLPLKWKVYASKSEAEKGEPPRWYETLALVAARAYDDKLIAHHPALDRFVTNAQHPYICFLKKEYFVRIPAGQILLGNRDSQRGRIMPAGDEKVTLRKLSGKIVLVGEISRDLDEHPSVVGRVSGLYMQANYIEALLDDRYYRPLPILDYVIGLAFLVALELILIVFQGSWLKLTGLIALLFILMVGLLYLIIIHLGWYVNPAMVGGVAVFIKVLQAIFGWVERTARAHEKVGRG